MLAVSAVGLSTPAASSAAVRVASAAGVTAKPPAFVVRLTLPRTAVPGRTVTLDFGRTAVPRGDRIASYTVDFGDHTRKATGRALSRQVFHRYAKAGTYSIRVSVTDTHHKHSFTSGRITVATPGAVQRPVPVPPVPVPPIPVSPVPVPPTPVPVPTPTVPVTPVPSPTTTTVPVSPTGPTTITLAGYSMVVPAGTVASPATATATLVDDSSGYDLGQGIDFSLSDSSWEGTGRTVAVTVPPNPDLAAFGAGWSPAVVHLPASGAPQLFSGPDVSQDPSTGGLTVQLTSLSPVFSSLLPPSLLSTESITETPSTLQWITREISAYTGLDADQPTCSPDDTNDADISTHGDPVTSSQGPGGQRADLLYCVHKVDGDGWWELANNTGVTATLHVTGEGSVISTYQSGDDYLSNYYAKAYNLPDDHNVAIPPGGAVTVDVTGTGSSNTSTASVTLGQSLALNPVYLVLREVGTITSYLGKAGDLAGSIYSTFTDCNFAATNLLSDVRALKCLKSALPALAAGSATSAATQATLKKAGAVADYLALIADSIVSTYDSLNQSIGQPGPAALTLGSADNDPAVEPSTDRPATDYPVVTGAKWSVPMSYGGQVLPQEDGSIVTSGCDGNDEDAGASFNLQRVNGDGSLRWRRAGENNNCAAQISDTGGNTYYFENDGNGNRVRSVDSSGNVRWTSPRLSSNLNYVCCATLGADGNIYFTQTDSYGHQGPLVLRRSDGAVVKQAWSAEASYVAYKKGLIELSDYNVDVAYLDYAGNPVKDVDLSSIVSRDTSGEAVDRATSTVYVAGSEYETCGPTGTFFSVTSVTPNGIAWSWHDPSSNGCESGSATALPEGGVAVEEIGAGSDRVLVLDVSGQLLWSEYLPTNNSSQFLGPIIADTKGTLVIPVTQVNDNTQAYDLNLAFLSYADGSAVSPSLVLGNPDGGAWGHVAIAAGNVYVSAGSSYTSSGDYAHKTTSLNDISVAALADDFMQRDEFAVIG